MEISIAGQGIEFALAVLAGMCLGVVYDIMHVIRGRLRLFIITAVLDVLFWIVCAVTAFWFAMGWGGGELRLFSIVGMVAGAVVYFLLLSMIIRAGGYVFLGGIIALIQVLAVPFISVGRLLKIFWKNLKNVFSFAEKKNRMRETARDMARAERRMAGAERGIRIAQEEASPFDKTRDGDIRGVRRDHSADASGQNQQRESLKRGQERGAFTAAHDKRGAEGGYSI